MPIVHTRWSLTRALSLVFGVSLLACSAGRAQQTKVTTRIVLLGTGTPVPDHERAGPALAIVVGQRAYLVDAGAGVVRQATRAAREKGVKQVLQGNLAVVFLTHLHSDHTLGLPDLMLTPLEHRKKPLEIHGPPGTAAMVSSLVTAFDEDLRIRTTGLEKVDPSLIRPVVHEVRDGQVFKDENVTVSAFPVMHGTFPVALGYKFVTPDRTIVISGDTKPCPELIEQAKGADVLIHEVYSMQKYAAGDRTRKDYLAAFHTSSAELALIATKARPKLLVLTHKLGTHGMRRGTILGEVKKAGYRGRAVDGEDLDVY